MKYNTLTGAIPDSIGNMVHLSYLYATISLFINLLSLIRFFLHYSLFLVLSVFSRESIYSYLNNNLLNGTIPDSIANLSGLMVLYVVF